MILCTRFKSLAMPISSRRECGWCASTSRSSRGEEAAAALADLALLHPRFSTTQPGHKAKGGAWVAARLFTLVRWHGGGTAASFASLAAVLGGYGAWVVPREATGQATPGALKAKPRKTMRQPAS
jgi:hypothetical protein